jgi:hypothetical protein
MVLAPRVAASAGPRQIAELEERPNVVQIPDGSLMAFSMQTRDGTQEVVARFSKDEDDSWGEKVTVLSLSKEPGGWAGPEVLVDREGEIHLFLLNDANTGIIQTGEERAKPVSSEKRLDIWHTKSSGQRTRWEDPKQIWQGYTGALNSVIQMENGRILLPFSCRTSRNWGNRGEGLDTFTFRGQFDSTLVYSDDDGDTWLDSPSRLKCPVPDITGSYGAVEPVVLQLKDGRVWMLIRAQMGRFYESFSEDGIQWATPSPSLLISSDSPAGLVRLPDGRIVLLWNKCLRFPYAHGGRHVLHAAISEDEGQTWRGHREVARDPLRDDPPPPHGDHGTAYPFPTSLRSGNVIFTTGQGEGRTLCMLLEPDWLYETEQSEGFASGLSNWSVFGTKGVQLVSLPEEGNAQVLSIRKADKDWPASAVWNFPLGTKGELRLKILVNPGCTGVLIGLTDHFSVPFDEEDAIHNLYNIRIGPEGKTGRGIPLAPGKWTELEIKWDCGKRECEVFVDGEKKSTIFQSRASEGVCYLRLRSAAETTEEGGFLVESAEAAISPASR